MLSKVLKFKTRGVALIGIVFTQSALAGSATIGGMGSCPTQQYFNQLQNQCLCSFNSQPPGPFGCANQSGISINSGISKVIRTYTPPVGTSAATLSLTITTNGSQGTENTLLLSTTLSNNSSDGSEAELATCLAMANLVLTNNSTYSFVFRSSSGSLNGSAATSITIGGSNGANIYCGINILGSGGS